MPRGKAYVLGLRDLTVGRPPLGVAVARSLGLEHIVEDLLEGASVDGVTGIGPDGEILAPSPSDRHQRRGTVLVLLGGIVLLVGATAADSLSLVWVIVWTIGSFALIFGGLRDILRRLVPRRGRPTTRPVDGEPSAHGADARAAHRPGGGRRRPGRRGAGSVRRRGSPPRGRRAPPVLARRRLARGIVGNRWCSIWLSRPPNRNPTIAEPARLRELWTCRSRKTEVVLPGGGGHPHVVGQETGTEVEAEEGLGDDDEGHGPHR